MKKVRILFQGDSITDAGRDKRNYYDLGSGYPKYAAQTLAKECPDVEFEFINLGLSGNRTSQLFDRLYSDCISLQPDVVSVLIGINDIWHAYDSNHIATTDEQFALNYLCILERIRNETNAKIVMLAPFLLDVAPYEEMRADLERRLPVVRKLAEEYADVYIPLDKYFEEALKTAPEPRYYSADGVHPNDNGRMFIGEKYAEAVLPLIKKF